MSRGRDTALSVSRTNVEIVLEGLRRYEADDMAEHRFANVGIVAAQGDWVVVGFTWEARGSTSGIESAFDICAAYRAQDGRIAEARFRWEEAEPLEAAGLRDQRFR